MANSETESSGVGGSARDDVVDLEPASAFELRGIPDARRGAGALLAEGSVGSLTDEMQNLRRARLGSAALFLAAVFGVLFLWSLLSQNTGHWIVSVMVCLRFAIAAACAGLILSHISLTAGQVRAVEYVLFGSFAVILAFNQYWVNLELMERDEVLALIANMKNGVLATFGLMVVYGMFIPNRARMAARVVLSMAVVTLFSHVLLLEHPGVAVAVEQLRTAEQAGTNALALMIGAGLAIYGTHVLNGLRAELHEARKLGQYQLREKLGGGGMGEIYLAEHQLLKRPCALKLISPEAGADPVALARFEREVQSAARLSHPNTIEIYDYGHAADGTFYYVMEYLPGMNLNDLVHRFGPLPAGRAIYLFRQVCAGLAEAHALGLVHRDLKPANIYVALRGGECDVAKVLDFGLVKLTRDPSAVTLTEKGRVSGTPLYMAPEQAVGDRPLDARTDFMHSGRRSISRLPAKRRSRATAPWRR
jgi:serine/threonine-protein kinase